METLITTFLKKNKKLNRINMISKTIPKIPKLREVILLENFIQLAKNKKKKKFSLLLSVNNTK